jgi:hypothetical protein
MWPFKSKKLPYADPDRLADVIALIQVLALHKYGDRSEEGITGEMQVSPRSGSTWKEIAQQHPEFFRLNAAERLGVSLVARHVMPKDEKGKRELPSDFTSILLRTAIDLHDRQIARAHPWKAYVNTVIPGVLVIAAALLSGYYTQKWTLDREIKIRDHEKRQAVYSELMGINVARKHLITAHTNATIELNYYELRGREIGFKKDEIPLVLDAARYAQKSANEYLIEITRKDQKLFELLGLVKILFPASPLLDEKIDRIYHAKYLEIIRPKKGTSLPQIQEWRDKAFKEVQGLVAKEYGEPMEDLLSYLSSYLR